MSIAIAAVMGLLIGSFLTVVVDRVPRGASINHPGSSCGNCGLRLGPLDLVPVVSWLALRGRCRRCHTSIGIEPLVLEIVTAALFSVTAWHFGGTWLTAGLCAVWAGLIALSWIDLRTRRLPREIVYVTAAVGLALLAVAALVADEPRRIATMALGAALALALMGLIYVASRGGMGDGDVRLAPLLGATVGWFNPGVSLVALFFGFLLGAVVGVVLLVTRRAGRRTAIPFGPFLVAGTILATFYGQRYVDLLLGR